jgi:hypothetical protein
MKNILTLLLACAFILSACKDKQTNERYRTVRGNIIRQTFDKNNKLLSEQQVIKADVGYIPNGTYIDYYPSGKIQHIKFYENGKGIGNYYKFSESGIIDSILLPCMPKPCYRNNTGLAKLEYLDTMSVHTYIPVVLQTNIYIGINNVIMSNLSDDSGHVVWADTLRKDNKGGMGIYYLPFLKAVVDKPGHYTFSTTVSYIDNMTNLTLIEDTITVHLLALKGYHGEGSAIRRSIQK